MENPKNIDPNKIPSTDNRIDFSLPYFVYITKMVRDINPMIRNIHASAHKVIEGIADIYQ
ncbi:hypothetical protein LCGC14_0596400 [marine sediment metagenome]|jgi:hypothetical protein|uniref:Uncharacterized protein n=1 Tax=marine sediment metagenome TaxID=412755 RepID=A0A0F9RBU0_9ZZZZ